jgi:hypothetical protein
MKKFSFASALALNILTLAVFPLGAFAQSTGVSPASLNLTILKGQVANQKISILRDTPTETTKFIVNVEKNEGYIKFPETKITLAPGP